MILRPTFATLLVVLSGFAYASEFPFTLHKLKSANPGPTVLVIGGIQGDEPGGFTAASLLVTDYRIENGEVWVVPNLNFESIIKRSRGVHGDMNRKFLQIPESDPEFQAVAKIKRIITEEQVDLVLNLHDGSGFFNPHHIDKDENPKRWGQSVVIDQANIEARRFGNLGALALDSIDRANRSSTTPRENFRLKNTQTRLGNTEMEKTLTYFAIRHGKAAMGVEASKNYPTARRIFNHLRLVEAIFERIGIAYQRSFKLTSAEIERKLGRDIQLALFDNKILYDFDKARARINYVPLKKESAIKFRTNNPLVAIINSAKSIKVRYGNRGVTTLNPQFFDYDHSLAEIPMVIDGRDARVPSGTVVAVDNSFMIQPIDGMRVNVIGFRKSGRRNESGLLIRQADINKRFSVDQQAQRFRVEFYREDRYSGMILIDFSARPKLGAKNPLYSTPGQPG